MQLPENTEFDYAVGALVTLEIEGVKHVILQKRPLFKPDGTPESFPNGLDPTVRGRLESTDRVCGKVKGSVLKGLIREADEEIKEMILRSGYKTVYNYDTIGGKERNSLTNLSGDNFVKLDSILKISRKVQTAKNFEEDEEKTRRKTNITFGSEFTVSAQENSHLTAALQQLVRDDVLVLLSAEDLHRLIPLDPKLHKENGVQEEGKYGMFADEIEAVKKALGVVE